MKATIWMCALAFFLAACSNNESGGHAGHDGHDTTKAGTPAATMASIMQGMEAEMAAAGTSGDPDFDFARLMEVHHRSAVEMAQLELEQGKDAEMQALARKIIGDQEREIGVFNAYLQKAERPDTTRSGAAGGGHEGHGHGMDPVAEGGSIDRQFAAHMIPHHQGAIGMARTYLAAGPKDAQLKSVAQAILTSQQKEIEQLQAWLKSNGD